MGRRWFSRRVGFTRWVKFSQGGSRGRFIELTHFEGGGKSALNPSALKNTYDEIYYLNCLKLSYHSILACSLCSHLHGDLAIFSHILYDSKTQRHVTLFDHKDQGFQYQPRLRVEAVMFCVYLKKYLKHGGSV